MSQEGQLLDLKSLRSVTGKTADWNEIAKDCIAFANGAQYFELRIPHALSVASTIDGRYYLRVADQSTPVTGDDVMRLASERSALPWETQTTLNVTRTEAESAKPSKLSYKSRLITLPWVIKNERYSVNGSIHQRFLSDTDNLRWAIAPHIAKGEQG